MSEKFFPLKNCNKSLALHSVQPEQIPKVWLAAISANLVTTGKYFDVAVRDLVLAVGAYTLASLTEAMVEPAALAQRIHGNAEQAHSPGLEA